MKSPIVIIGFGNQAKVWAQNLTDCGHQVKVYLKKGSPSIRIAKRFKFEVINKQELKFFQYFCLLIPDTEHEKFLKQNNSLFSPQSTFIYAHGYSSTKWNFPKLYSQFNHLLIAPKAIAKEMRNNFLKKLPVPIAYSFEHVAKNKKICLYAKKIMLSLGSQKAQFPTTFLEETIADLFSEQTILCNILPHMAEKSFQFLLSKGINPNIAYLECWYEVKLIAQALIDAGPEQFFKMISPNALIGAEINKKQFINNQLPKKFSAIFNKSSSSLGFKKLDHYSYEKLLKLNQQYWKMSQLEKTHQKLKKIIYSKNEDS